MNARTELGIFRGRQVILAEGTDLQCHCRPTGRFNDRAALKNETKWKEHFSWSSFVNKSCWIVSVIISLILSGSLLMVRAALCVQSCNLTAVIWLLPGTPPPATTLPARAEFAHKADFDKFQVSSWPFCSSNFSWLHFRYQWQALFHYSGCRQTSLSFTEYRPQELFQKYPVMGTTKLKTRVFPQHRDVKLITPFMYFRLLYTGTCRMSTRPRFCAGRWL